MTEESYKDKKPIASLPPDQECTLLRDEYIAQLPAHASYILASVVGGVVLFPSLFSAIDDAIKLVPSASLVWLTYLEIGILSAGVISIAYLFFRELGRLFYFVELASITADMLGTNGPRIKERYEPSIRYIKDDARWYGISAVIFAELFIRMTCDYGKRFMIPNKGRRFLIRHFSTWENPKKPDEKATTLRKLQKDSIDQALAEIGSKTLR